MNDAVLRLRLPLGEGAPSPVSLPAGLVLEPFAPTHGPAVETLLAAAREDGLAGSPDAVRDWFAAVSRDDEWDPALVVLVRESATGPLAGVAHAWTSSFLKDLAVAQSWRRRGLASALVAEIAGRLAERGHGSLDLKVRTVNAPARALYRRLRFVAAD